jgi:hypothetical protein
MNIGDGGKGKLTLKSDANHFAVIEAKMFSPLSGGITHAPGYNQAARNIACMAEALRIAGRRPTEFGTLGFYVLAPECQLDKGMLKNHLNKDHLCSVVQRRANEFLSLPDMGKWFSDWFLIMLERLTIRKISWEEIIRFLQDRGPNTSYLGEFYAKCLEFNRARPL